MSPVPVKVRATADDRSSDAVVIPVAKNQIGKPLAGRTRAPWDYLKARGFEAKAGEVCVAPGTGGRTTLFVGVGPAAEVTTATLRRAAGASVRAAGTARSLTTFLASAAPAGLDNAEVLRAVAEGSVLAAYRFSEATKKKGPAEGRLRTVSVVDPEGGGRPAQAAVAAGVATAEAACLARDLVNTPGGELTASAFADRAADVAEATGLDVHRPRRGRPR